MSLGKSFPGEFVSGHEAERFGEARGSGGELIQHRDDLEVETARVDLADIGEEIPDPEMGREAALEFEHSLRVALEEAELVELRADRALEPTHRIACDERVETLRGVEQFFAEHGEAFAVGRDLRGDVVGAGGDDEVAVFVGFSREAVEGCRRGETDHAEAAVDLELLDVLGEVAARHALVDVLVSGEITEFLDARLHVVAGDALTGIDRSQVDLIDDTLIGGDGLGGNVETEVALCLHHRDPELALETDFSFGGPDRFHGGGGIAFGEDVGDHGEEPEGR